MTPTKDEDDRPRPATRPEQEGACEPAAATSSARPERAPKESAGSDEPLDRRLCLAYRVAHAENEGERRERNLRERQGPDDFVPARRPLEEEDGEAVVDTAVPPERDHPGHRGGFA